MSGNLTTLIILVTLLHVAAFTVMIMIRLRREDADRATDDTAQIRPCAVCSAPATHLGYDGLDPNERRDPYTSRPYSIDTARYLPLCAAH